MSSFAWLLVAGVARVLKQEDVCVCEISEHVLRLKADCFGGSSCAHIGVGRVAIPGNAEEVT